MEKGEDYNSGQCLVYLANQFGFSQTGSSLLDQIKLRLSCIGFTVFEPFCECNKEFEWEKLEQAKKSDSLDDYLAFWKDINQTLGYINEQGMKRAHLMTALLDGGHSVDDGVAAEIGYFAALERGPIIALRTDLRCGENPACLINPQLLYFIEISGGQFIGPDQGGLDGWYKALQEFYDNFKKN